MKFDRCEDIGNGVCELICNIDRKGLQVQKRAKSSERESNTGFGIRIAMVYNPRVYYPINGIDPEFQALRLPVTDGLGIGTSKNTQYLEPLEVTQILGSMKQIES